MTREPRRKKKNKKDSQLTIRIDSDQRERFVTYCDENDTSAAREIRKFIRSVLDGKNHDH